MIRGIDRFVEHGGRRYLVECEDLGLRAGRVEVRILEEGEILWSKSVPYFQHPEERWKARCLRQLMERLFVTTQAAIARGRFA